MLDLSVHEFSVRRIAGDEPQITEYEERFTELADALRDRLVSIEESLDVESSIRGLLRDTDPLFRERPHREIAPTSGSGRVESNELDPPIADDEASELPLLDRVLRRPGDQLLAVGANFFAVQRHQGQQQIAF